MRYISDDGKVFNTEQECREHEQRVKQEKIKKQYKEICEDIYKHYVFGTLL